jgi:hypothetical protein
MSRTYSPKTAPIYQFKIALDYITPSIWRRFLVSSNITLDRLHDTIQIVMGWTNSHLHMFEINGQRYSDHQYEDFEELDTVDERDIRLRKIIGHEGLRFQYEYDFGDGWRHTLRLEQILPPDPGRHLPVCLEGKRACPPEDVGGIGGYGNFLEAIRDPEHEEHDEYLTWVGGKYNPNAFDLELVNRQLRKMKIAPDAWQKEEYPSWPVEQEKPALQPSTLNEAERQAVEALPLRRDVLTLMNYLKVNRVTGTQSTGNLPLKAILAICAKFVDPPQLETRIGEFVSRMRSEDDVWLLFQTWWTQVNWGIAWRNSPDEFPPAHIRKIILERLLSLPQDHSLPFERFADQVLEASRLTWPHGDGSQERSILHSLIESTVVEPLSRFEVLDLEYGPHPTWGTRFRELHTLTLTALGKSLLGSMKE